MNQYDYSKLSGKIVEVCRTQAIFARKMGLSERSISLKLNNKVPFNQLEIEKAMDILKIDAEEMQKYFFKKEVQNN